MKVHSNRNETVEVLEVCVETRSRGEIGGFGIGFQRMTSRELLKLVNSPEYLQGDSRITEITSTGQYLNV